MTSDQLENRNLLSPVGFKLILDRCNKVDFFAQSANIPGISMGTALQPTPFKDIDLPGDKVRYDDLNVRFLVDEDMENYLQIYKWLVGLGYPDNMDQFTDLKNQREYLQRSGNADPFNLYSDGTLQILNSSLMSKISVKFKQLFPISLSTLTFDASENDTTYFTAEVTFRYTIFKIVDSNGNEY